MFAIDDHTGDSGDVPDETAYGKAVQNARDAARAPAKPVRDREDALTKRGDMLGLYRHINRPDVQRIAIDSEFAATPCDPLPASLNP